LGFANALQAVNNARNTINREPLIACQGKTLSLIGELSVDSRHQYH
jgi:hypothetical protein